MDQAANSRDSAPSLPLWVVVASGKRSLTFELDDKVRTAIVIGSSHDSEYSFVDSRLSPIECFLEREGDDIWLVPGSPSDAIRVDTVAVVRPIRLWRRCVVEVGAITFAIRIREEPPTSPDNEIPTVRAESLFVAEDVPQVEPHVEIAPATVGRSERQSSPPMLLALSPPDSSLNDDGGASVSVRTIIAIEAAESVSGAAIIQSRSADFNVERQQAPGRDLHAPAHAEIPPDFVDDRKRSSPDLPEARVAEHQVHLVSPGRQIVQVTLDAGESPPSSTSPAVASIRVIANGPTLPLEQLGVFAQRRPWLVIMAVIFGGMTIASIVHFGSQALVAWRQGDEMGRTVAAEFPRLAPFCGSEALGRAVLPRETVAERRKLCGWLPSAWPSANSDWGRVIPAVVPGTASSGTPSMGTARIARP